MEAFFYFIENTENGLDLIIGTVCFLLAIVVPIALVVLLARLMIKSGKKNIKNINDKLDEKNKK